MSKEKKCIEVKVIAKESGEVIEGTLCETARGTYFKPKSPVDILKGKTKK